MFENNDAESVNLVKELLDTKLNCKLKRTKEFNLFDLRDKKNKIIVEVKERYNTKNKYPTTMVGENKYIKAKDYFDRSYEVLFVFKFTDGVYYYEYCDEDLPVKIGGRCGKCMCRKRFCELDCNRYYNKDNKY